ncbi:MAG: amidohydrolase family protein [Pirellulaceae bacterium]|nr:amidohydrolase family protein [Pirellulaceae bacterium]
MKTFHYQSLPSLALLVLTCIGLAGGTPTASASPEIPGAPQAGPIALVGGTVHPISGPAIERGTVLFDQGRIVAVGRNVALPAGTETIDVTGKHVYPGLFDPYTHLGLVEINAVRATVDQSETGRINPNARAQVAVNPDSELIPVARSGGVLLALTAPTGGLISGTSTVLQLDGWTWEDLTLRAAAGMHVAWPRMTPVSDWWVEQSPAEQIANRDQALDELRTAFESARAYQAARQADPSRPVDARWEALLPVLNRGLPLIVAADDLPQIQAAVSFAQREKVRLIILGGYDAPRCAPLLKKHDVPVIVAGVYRLPQRRDDDYDSAYTLPARLHAAGIPFCISVSGRFGASDVRNLPYHAATAAAHGLPQDEALRSITFSPAQILGVAERVGSLEPNKDATLIVTTGNPLETETRVEAAYIQGRQVDLSDRHKRLYRKYQEKYRRLAE